MPSAKRALYVLRTAATGRHLLAHGEVVTDVARLRELVPIDAIDTGWSTSILPRTRSMRSIACYARCGARTGDLLSRA